MHLARQPLVDVLEGFPPKAVVPKPFVVQYRQTWAQLVEHSVGYHLFEKSVGISESDEVKVNVNKNVLKGGCDDLVIAMNRRSLPDPIDLNFCGTKRPTRQIEGCRRCTISTGEENSLSIFGFH